MTLRRVVCILLLTKFFRFVVNKCEHNKLEDAVSEVVYLIDCEIMFFFYRCRRQKFVLLACYRHALVFAVRLLQHASPCRFCLLLGTSAYHFYTRFRYGVEGTRMYAFFWTRRNSELSTRLRLIVPLSQRLFLR